MSWSEQMRAMARYNRWMNGKLYELVGTMDDLERKRPRGAFFGSIHGTLNHILLADRTWMTRFTGDTQRYASRDAQGEVIVIRALAQELYSDFTQLRSERERTDGDIVAWTDQLDDATLAGELEYKNMNGVSQRHPAYWAIAHFFNHQTHHRGQVTTLLMQAGIDPGVTDLVYMLRQEPAAPKVAP